MRFKWIYQEVDNLRVAQLAEMLNISRAAATVLMNRGFDTVESTFKFFHPKLDDLYDPFLMADMETAVERIKFALANKEKVIIFGDYDVDGITSTSMLYLYLGKFGLDTLYYIPDREKEGYGISIAGIESAAEAGTKLIISCDCGINAFEQIEYANSKNIDVIVTDHHEPAEYLPDALAVLDPKREDDRYPFKDLCGAGVAFKLLQALSREIYIPPEELYRHLDLVAIGTAADIVPILDENRILVAKGLEILSKTNKVGVKARIRKAGFDINQLNVPAIVFGLAPRLNAAGRMGGAARAVKLLSSFDPLEAQDLANELDTENRTRQNIEKETIDSAILQLNATHNLDKDKIFILNGTDWHQGVIGIVASKLKELYNRPVVMISFQNGIGKGSARSIPGFDLYAAFTDCQEFLSTFGGHKMAAGLTITYEQLPLFSKRLKQIAYTQISDSMLSPNLNIECEISFSDINQDMLEFLQKMAPFGPGNMRPIFSSRNVEISGFPRVVKENHLKFKASQEHIVISCIGWKLSNLYEMLISNQPLDISFVIEENKWRGIREIQLNIKDIHYSNTSG
jgi:single-stranded-DNA-specific exonuclease